jgi:hypothetical protein
VKQVHVNDLVVYTGPDVDAFKQAANLVRQAALSSGLRFAQVLNVEDAARHVEAGVAGRVVVGDNVITVTPADITQLVPECEHELYAAGWCRKPPCPNYYLRSVA